MLPSAVVQLLPTPTSSDTNGAGAHGTGGADLRTTVALLPTPTTTQRGTDANLDTREGARANLHNEVAKLLPTPSVADATGGHERRGGERGGELLLKGIAREVFGPLLPTPLVGSTSPASHGQISGQWRDAMSDALSRWCEYAEAIASHERLTGRPAPDPTEPGPKGNPRLSARFVEWMMALPDGWVTDCGITRNQALRALGNGVVPLQAAHALRVMLARMETAA